MATSAEILAQIAAKQSELATLQADLQAARQAELAALETTFSNAVTSATSQAAPHISAATTRIDNAVAISESAGLPFRIVQGPVRLVYTPTTLVSMWGNVPIDFWKTYLILPGRSPGWSIR